LALAVADFFSDPSIIGNGTAHALVRIFGAPGSAIIVHADATFTLDAGDLIFTQIPFDFHTLSVFSQAPGIGH
jgi:hypothetical protein